MYLLVVGKGKIMNNIFFFGGKVWKKNRENVIFVWVLFVFGKGEGVGVVGY